MLPKLIENSKFRLDEDKDFQFFLKVANGHQPKQEGFSCPKEHRASNYGVEDLQMKEAVHIIQDMIFLN